MTSSTGKGTSAQALGGTVYKIFAFEFYSGIHTVSRWPRHVVATEIEDQLDVLTTLGSQKRPLMIGRVPPRPSRPGRGRRPRRPTSHMHEPARAPVVAANRTADLHTP